MLDQRPGTFVNTTKTNESFLTPAEKSQKIAFLRSPVSLTTRCPSSTSRVCMDGVRLVARSYGDIITKFSRSDGLPIFLKNETSLRALRAKAPLILFKLGSIEGFKMF